MTRVEKERRERIKDRATWVLAILVAILCVVATWTVIRVGGIETSNRDIICQSRKLREQYPPVTPLERAQLDNARKKADECR